MKFIKYNYFLYILKFKKLFMIIFYKKYTKPFYWIFLINSSINFFILLCTLIIIKCNKFFFYKSMFLI